MYANYNGLDMYCDLTNNRKGRYEISAKIGGLGIRLFTDDAEIYDYFDEDYYDADDPDWARRVAFDMLMEEACKRFIGALVTYNADPFLVEHDELALDVIKAIDKHYTNPVELTPDDDEEFVDACERLDLDPEANDVKRVLSYPPTNSAPGILICMSEDWEIA
jgi:hypothetical protein